MAISPIAKGTLNWDAPLNTQLAQLDANTTAVSGASLQKSNNLSDLTNPTAARSNLGLTGLANAKSNLTATTNPTTGSDTTQGYSVGSTWVNTSTNSVFVCANATTGAAVWTQIPTFPLTIAQGGTGSTTQNFVDLSSAQTITGNKTYSGSPVFNGTTNSFTNGLAVTTAGKGISIKSGTNAKAGTTAAMTAGTIAVTTTAVTANSVIILSQKTIGGTPGALFVSAVTAGSGFTIKSTSSTDTSTVNWIILDTA